MRILWATDAFESSPDLDDNIVRVIRRFTEKQSVEIEPVYVLSPDQLNLNVEFSAPWTEDLMPAATKGLKYKLRNADIPGITAPQILIHARSSLKGAVDTLATYAESNNHDFIVTGSHSRKGLKRLVLGSFSEELLLRSNLPVLVVGSHMESWSTAHVNRPLRMLIPNDLSDPTSSFFGRAFGMAKDLKAETSLLHVIPRPAQMVLQSGVYLVSGGWVPVPLYMEKESEKQKHAASRVLLQAHDQNVSCDLIVDAGSTSVVDSILKNARETQSNVVAMASQSGSLAATLIGSITRQVVRTSPCPVMVFPSM